METNIISIQIYLTPKPMIQSIQSWDKNWYRGKGRKGEQGVLGIQLLIVISIQAVVFCLNLPLPLVLSITDLDEPHLPAFVHAVSHPCYSLCKAWKDLWKLLRSHLLGVIFCSPEASQHAFSVSLAWKSSNQALYCYLLGSFIFITSQKSWLLVSLNHVLNSQCLSTELYDIY